MRRATITIPSDLERQLEAYLASQDAPPSLTRVVQAALRRFLAEAGASGTEIREPGAGYDAEDRGGGLPLDPETTLLLQEEARRSKTSPEELVATIVREFLEGRGAHRRRLRGVGRYRSGRADVSTRAEQILRGAARRGE